MPEPTTLATDLHLAAARLVDSCDRDQITSLSHEAESGLLRQWTYLPHTRPGLLLGDCSKSQRLIVQEILSLILSEACHAQVAAIMATEDILNRREGYRRGRHYTDFWIILFGTPGASSWAWRMEGHHLCINITVDHSSVLVSPLFLGCHPAGIDTPYGRILAPLENEERIARQLLLSLPPEQRQMAQVNRTAPADIYTRNIPDMTLSAVWPKASGVVAGDLSGPALTIASELIDLYSQRFNPMTAAQPGHLPLNGDWSFSWEGSADLGAAHYYRIRNDKWLIELCNSSNQANHVHNVYRRLDEFPRTLAEL